MGFFSVKILGRGEGRCECVCRGGLAGAQSAEGARWEQNSPPASPPASIPLLSGLLPAAGAARTTRGCSPPWPGWMDSETSPERSPGALCPPSSPCRPRSDPRAARGHTRRCPGDSTHGCQWQVSSGRAKPEPGPGTGGVGAAGLEPVRRGTESSQPGPYATLRLFIWAPGRGEDLSLPMGTRGPLTISSPPSARPFPALCPPGEPSHPASPGPILHPPGLWVLSSVCASSEVVSHHTLPPAAPSAGKQNPEVFQPSQQQFGQPGLSRSHKRCERGG